MLNISVQNWAMISINRVHITNTEKSNEIEERDCKKENDCKKGIIEK